MNGETEDGLDAGGRTNRRYYAHSKDGADGAARPKSEWQPLDEHLLNVADLAGGFAASFGAEEWGYLAGLWHDAGKYSAAFQQYLEGSARGDYHSAEVRGKVDHTTAGAQHAAQAMAVIGHLLAYVVSGHHAGLLDAIGEGACLDARLRKTVEPWQHGLSEIPARPLPKLPGFLTEGLSRRGLDPHGSDFSFAFFTRMLFSCLVDADFLDTEAFLNGAQAAARPVWPPGTFAKMEEVLASFIGGIGQPMGLVDRQRAEVRAACVAAATGRQGLFSLTVPTGGGKTLSSLAFALRHAVRHDLRRIVYVVPFTTIIEQNADVFRRVVRPLVEAGLTDPVLEHHSSIDAGAETLESRLACENWDAPLVVTTAVQFFESLFANRTSRCRKLHNLTRSVIILDEAQKIPVQYLAPCLSALRELAANYRATVVLCTATQPAIHYREEFPIGLEGVREIVPDPPSLYLALKRVEVENLGAQSDDELVGRLRGHHQVLCVVNTRRHARLLYERLQGEGGALHLSAAMCPEHRTEVLTRVRDHLGRGEPCRVISTQLVEAGVDLDFPTVYRSLAGLDSIAQAAGRCNRNGRLPSARAFVFRSEHQDAEVFLRDTANVTSQLLGDGTVPPLFTDPLSLEAVERYFRLYYWSQQERWDQAGVIAGTQLQPHCRSMPFKFDFAEIAGRFKLIDNIGEPVIVPWGDRGERLCQELRSAWRAPPRRLLRQLQRFTVQVPRNAYYRQLNRAVELVHERYAVLTSPELYYGPDLGLVLEREDFDSATFII